MTMNRTLWLKAQWDESRQRNVSAVELIWIIERPDM
jgi:hypothetical protein